MPETGAAISEEAPLSSSFESPAGPPSDQDQNQPTRRKRIIVGAAVVVVLSLLTVLGYAGYVYLELNSLKKSSILNGVGGKDVNMLIMGLDSRLDENGNPLPADVYNALHAGGSDVGGYNSNVLIYVHIPADGSQAIGISIPRDDYAPLHGCPYGVCHGKIKEAYGLALAQKQNELARKGVTGASAYQQARDAGRLAEIQTVDDFLGVKINRFVEVTMGAFYQIAQVVQPITVCVKENTSDLQFSGASFKAGVQSINAREAVAFVRQRRDYNNPALNFTDLDRERRQQAFIISLLTQLKSANTLLDPTKVLSLVDVAKRNVVISAGLDPIAMANLGSTLAGGGLHFFTLPIVKFGVIDKQDVNIVDPAQIKATVASLLRTASGTSATPSPTTSAIPNSSLTVNVVNASGVDGAAGGLSGQLTAKGYKQGAVTTGTALQSATVITYAPSDAVSAAQLRAAIGGTVQLVVDRALRPDELTIVIGTSRQSTTPASQAAVSGTGGGKAGPPVTALTDISSGGIPCVK